ncbi:hypothetical protein [Neisseria gonorrhoeae]|uniref:hypothetical protein n=1 Tax=Neisseria gonorrhoeae TaxID=485 RepID=UPI00067BD070|nr:hypothetical protein [Neisseria gonorrhoeae]
MADGRKGFFDAIIKINIFFFPVKTPTLGVANPIAGGSTRFRFGAEQMAVLYVPFCVLKHIGR